MSEYTTLRITRHRSPDGRPTCCQDLRAGAACEFLRFLGAVPVCALSDKSIIKADNEFTIPHDQCIVWEDS